MTHKKRSVKDQDQLLNAIIENTDLKFVDASDRAMLIYVRKLTKSPSEISIDDISSLYQSGFDDRSVHDICTITAYFNFVNRIAEGLGVELEEGLEDIYNF